MSEQRTAVDYHSMDSTQVVATIQSLSGRDASDWFESWLTTRDRFVGEVWSEDVATALYQLASELEASEASTQEQSGVALVVLVLRDAAATVATTVSNVASSAGSMLSPELDLRT